MEDETFEFYASAKMKGDPRWVDVTSLLTVEALVLKPEFQGLFTDEELSIARHRLEQFGYRA